MRRTLLALAAAAGALAGSFPLAGCGDGCQAACDFEDQDATRICDGDNFRTCFEGSRGDVIACDGTLSGQRAVCTPEGWTIEDTPAR